MNGISPEDYVTLWYKVIGPENETKTKLHNVITKSASLPPGQWRPKKNLDLTEIMQAASEETEDHYILLKFYQGIGNPVQENIYCMGEEFSLSDFINKEPEAEKILEETREQLKQQKMEQLQQQYQQLKQTKQQTEQQLDRIEEQLEEWQED